MFDDDHDCLCWWIPESRKEWGDFLKFAGIAIALIIVVAIGFAIVTHGDDAHVESNELPLICEHRDEVQEQFNIPDDWADGIVARNCPTDQE